METTVRAVVSSVQATPQPTAQPGDDIDVQATIIASVQATVEALWAATPIPSPTPTDAPAALLTPTAVISSNALPTPTVMLVTTPTPQPTLSSAPTPTAEPTPSATPLPVPTLAASCGTPAVDTQVTAWIDGQAVASAVVLGGAYIIFIDQRDSGQYSGKTVTFKIGNLDANESANWVQDGGSELDLTTSPADLSSSQPEPTTGPESAAAVQLRHGGPLAQRVPPHVFVGTATIAC